MDFYLANNVVFFTIIAGLVFRQFRQYWRDGKASSARGQDTEAAFKAGKAVLGPFRWKFLPVYLLAFGSDWLQGPYIYTMYKDEKQLPEETVAHLFMIGFLAAAISASFVGSLADRYGRKAACLVFCVAYSVSCFTVLSNSIYILFAGRIMGGLSTTLLYSVIESWMVTEFHRQHLEEAGSLSDLFGLMYTLNGFIAIIAGELAEFLADFTGTQAAPFMTAVVLLMAAFGLISKNWNENYGNSHQANVDERMPASLEKEKNGFQYIAHDKRLWALCMTSSCFEGSMYIWIFFKFPALKLSHQESGKGSDLPFGTIFAGLMAAMMFGSFFFTWYSALPKTKWWVVSSSTLLSYTLVVASFCFILPMITHNEIITFWSFCVFEMCCGIYFPSIAHLKEQIVEDGVRAKIYGILRIPLNIFVVLGLVLTQEGLHHRENVFMICSGALVLAAAALGAFVTE